MLTDSDNVHRVKIRGAQICVRTKLGTGARAFTVPCCAAHTYRILEIHWVLVRCYVKAFTVSTKATPMGLWTQALYTRKSNRTYWHVCMRAAGLSE